MRGSVLIFIISIISIGMTEAQDIKFPEPYREGGMSLTEALNKRHASRQFSSGDLSPDLMGNLFCASEDLNTGVRALINRDILREKMQLNDNQKIILAQGVGYPVK